MKKISNFHYYDEQYFDPLMPEKIVKFFPEKTSDFPFYISENFFSDRIAKQIETKIRMKSPIRKIGGGKSFEDEIIDEKIRNTYLMTLDEEVQELYIKKFNLLKPKIEDFYRINIISEEQIHALGYDPGCKFVNHSDNSSLLMDSNDQIYKWELQKPSRVLSVILFLTDCVDLVIGEQQCTGGDIVFRFIVDKDNKSYIFRGKKGTLIAFPSNPYYTHEVNTVKSGFRVSMVNWYDAILSI